MSLFSTKLFSTKGCIKRREWWTIVLCLLMCCGSINIIYDISGIDKYSIMQLLFIITCIIALYIYICACVKRLHDRDKGGYWMFLSFVPILRWWLLIECGFLRSVEESVYREEE